MCGRFNLVVPDLDELRRYLPVDEIDVERWQPRFNIAPGQLAPVLQLVDGQPTLVTLMSWGLMPPYATNTSVRRPINARVETLRQRPSFRTLLGTRQCIVPASGYYEWLAVGRRKQPWLITPGTGLLAMAGLWDRWTSRDGEVVDSFAVITTDAVPQIAHIHHRMPLLVEPGDARRWLAGQPLTTTPWSDAALALCAREVSARVNSAQHDDASLLQSPEADIESQLSLDLSAPTLTPRSISPTKPQAKRPTGG